MNSNDVAENSTVEVVRCLQCRKPFPDKLLRCPSCGTRRSGREPKVVPLEKVEKNQVGNVARQLTTCKSCGSKIPKHATVCRYCGVKLRESNVMPIIIVLLVILLILIVTRLLIA